MSAAGTELLAVGSIVKAFGIRGEVVIRPMTDSPARFRKLKNVLLGDRHGNVRTFALKHVSIDARGVRARLERIDTRTEADKLVGAILYVDTTDRVRLPKGRHFIHEMIGLKVRDQDGSPIGVLKDVLKLPGQDVYVIDRDGKEILVPAVKEFVTRVDVGEGTMTVKLIEGMLEEQ